MLKISREDLFREYVINKRSLRSIYMEYKCDSRTLKYRLSAYNIPLRTRNDRIAVSNVHNLSGTKIGKWTIGEKFIKYGYTPFYKCICECGKTAEIEGYSLIKGKSKGCMKCSKWTGFEEISGKYWRSIYAKSIERNIEFSISIEYIWDLFIKQQRKCAISGIELEFRKYRHDKFKNINAASLDRIDSSKGYIKGNVQWVHKDVNKMKQSFDNQYFIKMCKTIANWNIE